MESMEIDTPTQGGVKRKSRQSSEGATQSQSKRQRRSNENHSSDEENGPTAIQQVAGKILRVTCRNFMCHENLEVNLNENVNFIIGPNGSGKSAIMTALTLGLGARASITDRGKDVKTFIKNGKSSATIEIKLSNRGPMAYQYDHYGDSITIIRQIAPTGSGYKIKNWRGEVVSTKKDELNSIISFLNIQIDNPICVLNQDMSRAFLKTFKPEEKYNLFMKATRLDTIGDNYKKAQEQVEESQDELKEAENYLSDQRKHVKVLSQKIRALESLEEEKQKLQALQNELKWAMVNVEEKKMQDLDKKITLQQKNIDELEGGEHTRMMRQQAIAAEIENCIKRIKVAQSEADQFDGSVVELQSQYTELKKVHEAKKTKIRSIQDEKRRNEKNIKDLESLISNKEQELSGAHDKRSKAQDMMEKKISELDDINHNLLTKRTELSHFEENKVRLEQECHQCKISSDQKKNQIVKMNGELEELKKQSNNSLSVYGPNVPRLLRRIEEEFNRGRFKQMPRGPIGRYLSMRDSSWIPAVEATIGGLLHAFCVDNKNDAQIMNILIQEVYSKGRGPTLIISKFFDRVHDVSNTCSRSERYQNLLDAVDISDPVVANCLIDNLGAETLLLIPTTEEGCAVMEHQENVPRNCRKAITKQADTFHPAPGYRFYAGSVRKAQYLQVSTTERISDLEEELSNLHEEWSAEKRKVAEVQQKVSNNNRDLGEIKKFVMKLQKIQQSLQIVIDNCKETLEVRTDDLLEEHKSELLELQQKLIDLGNKLNELTAEGRDSHKQLEEFKKQIEQRRSLKANLEAKLVPIQDEIKDLRDEKSRLERANRGNTQRMEEAKSKMQKLQGEHEQQQRVVNREIEVAEAACPRLQSRRTPDELKQKVKDVAGNIMAVEQKLGDLEPMQAELEERLAKIAEVKDMAHTLKTTIDKQTNRIAKRSDMYEAMKRTITTKVQFAFSNILKLRHYKGKIDINHGRKVLELEVSPGNDVKRSDKAKDAKCLSGGERSYSTVAFILALWDCTGLPFYFLDEPDVYMDKINRKLSMDILLHHAKTHPNSQFAFLTPLDTSNIEAGVKVGVFRLDPPERS